jgi:hypothetical protein
MKTFLFKKYRALRTRGFILPFTLVVCVIILTIATGISIILTKELYFSKLSRLSQTAYYAADNGLMCATMIDDLYLDTTIGLGIFQYADTPTTQSVLDTVNARRSSQGLSTITLNDIKCATSAIFDTSVTGYAVDPFSRIDSEGNVDNGKTTTFNMKMDTGNSVYRCATVVVNKTPSYRQIISRGFASCNGATYAYPIERAIVSTSETSGASSGGTPIVTVQQEYTTPGSYMWTAPEGVTRVTVLAIGGGGAGGSSIKGGGGGGGAGLGYRNDISVTPGNTYRVEVGAGGIGVINGNGGDGQDSYFKDASTVVGMGGQGGNGGGNNNSYNGGNGGNHTGSGGNGGDGGNSSGELSGGGGGAGGYSGGGGNGDTNGRSGNGGGAAGGSRGGDTSTAGSAQSGGGVGIYGQGTSGTSPGAGGSGGTDGSPALTNCLGNNTGGTYGGGGAGQGDNSLTSPGCNGGGGAVRIIWPGDVRRYPSTRTANE